MYIIYNYYLVIFFTHNVYKLQILMCENYQKNSLEFAIYILHCNTYLIITCS